MDHCLILISCSAKRVAIPAWLSILLPKGAIGAYLLLREEDVFYVGRSDRCLRNRLANHSLLTNATHVCWELCGSPEHAFHKEAYWYDLLKAEGKLINNVHPAAPARSRRTCPFCDLDGQKIRAALLFAGLDFTATAPFEA